MNQPGPDMTHFAQLITSLQRSTHNREQAARAYLGAVRAQESDIRSAIAAGIDTKTLREITGFVRSNLYRIRDAAPADPTGKHRTPIDDNTPIDAEELRGYYRRAVRKANRQTP